MRTVVIVFVAIMLAACSATAPTSVATQAAAAVSGPAWMTMPFTNVKTNDQITLADFAGKTVVVEAMAEWCTNCLAQQNTVVTALPKLNDPQVVYMSLDIDGSEDVPSLAAYAQKHNFTWLFGMSTKDMRNALAQQFSLSFSNPSNVPIFMISPNGKVSQLYLGGHSADDLIGLIKAAEAQT
jgi:cytochrome oxidase Cu insertion factor (SCO1/SenC/PrrC family)